MVQSAIGTAERITDREGPDAVRMYKVRAILDWIEELESPYILDEITGAAMRRMERVKGGK